MLTLQSLQGIKDTVYTYEAFSIYHLQQRLPRSESLFLRVAELSDPAYAFSFWLPISAAFSRKLAADVLIVTFFTEWLNTLLKWLLMEDRPYWWVAEAGAGLRLPRLSQGPLTCETGPGSPSGHVMGAAGLAYAVKDYVNRTVITPSGLSDRQKSALRLLLWLLSAAAVLLVALCRLYTVTHFPHQCALGLLLGSLTARQLVRSVRSRPWRHAGKARCLLAVAAMTGLSAAAYWLQKGLRIDPQWSVKLAFKWCDDPARVHVSTTPLYSLVRDSGAALGLALAWPVFRAGAERGRWAVGLPLALGLTQLSRHLQEHIPTEDATLYYALQGLHAAAHAWACVRLLPALAGASRSLAAASVGGSRRSAAATAGAADKPGGGAPAARD